MTPSIPSLGTHHAIDPFALKNVEQTLCRLSYTNTFDRFGDIGVFSVRRYEAVMKFFRRNHPI